MKNLCLTVVIALFCMIISNGVQAQTTQTKIDQLKLAQTHLVNTWQRVISKDSVQVSETQKYGNATVDNIYLVVNGKKTFQFGITSVYSTKDDNFKSFWFYPNGSYSTLIGSFTAENKLSFNYVENFNPEKVLRKAERINDTPDSYTAIFYKPDGTKGREYKWTRVK